MAIRFDASGTDHLRRTTNVPNYNSVYSFAAWVKISVDTNDYASIFCIGVTSGTGGFDIVQTDSDGVTLHLASNVTNAGSTVLTVGTWYHVACVRESATSWKLYLNGALNATNTGNVGTSRATSAVALARTDLGGFTGEGLNGCLAAVKIWDAALTIDEIGQEMWSYLPARTANLNTWSPLAGPASEAGTDFSGNAYNWTVGGTLASEDGPPVTWSRGPSRVWIPQSSPAPSLGFPFPTNPMAHMLVR